MSIANEGAGSATPTMTAKELREKQLQISHAANAARDTRKWKEAAALYRQYLDLAPDSPSIWVQYGHMLKESGNRTEAATAYEEALRLEPENADTYLQFGHLYKLDKQKHKAIQMYKKALEIDPELKDAADELQRMGMKAQSDAVLKRIEAKRAKASFYFDVSDVLSYFGGARSPTGIQRICLALIDAVFAEHEDKDIGLCAVDHRAGVWRQVNTEMFLMLVLLSREGSEASDEQWREAVIEAHKDFATSAPLLFPQDSVVINLGSPWGIPNYFLAVRDAKRQSNIFYVGFVHDTIPLLYPEYCDANTAAAYTNWIASIGAHADLMLANAENTKRDFQTVLAKVGHTTVPCEVIFPNGDFSSDMESGERASEEVQGVIAGKYVLFVGTIEPRKNHLFVLSAWRRLVAEMGASKVPTLVIAGRLGWHCENVVEFVKKTDSLNGKLKMLNSVSDVDLQTLYRNAMFTVYNSLYEGWGLPVTESLSYGKVPVIPRNSSLVEAGGEHAVFYETNSEPSFTAAIRELLASPDAVKRREQAIVDEPPIRTWSAIFEDLYGVTTRAVDAARDNRRASRPLVRLGEIYKLRTRAARKDPMSLAIAEATRIGTGWHVPEEWGVWTAQKTFLMDFDIAGLDSLPVPLDSARPDLFMFLALTTQRDLTRLRIDVNDMPTEMIEVPGGLNLTCVLRIELHSKQIEDGRVRIIAAQSQTTDLGPLTEGRDTRVIGLGVRSFMICSAQDIVSRLEFLEEEGSNYLLVETDSV